MSDSGRAGLHGVGYPLYGAIDGRLCQDEHCKWFSALGRNSPLSRTSANKRHAVLLLLKDEEWTAWSDCEIARRCCVSRDLVQRIRPSLADSASEKQVAKTYTNKHGQTATMNTENIGKRESHGRENGVFAPSG